MSGAANLRNTLPPNLVDDLANIIIEARERDLNGLRAWIKHEEGITDEETIDAIIEGVKSSVKMMEKPQK